MRCASSSAFWLRRTPRTFRSRRRSAASFRLLVCAPARSSRRATRYSRSSIRNRLWVEAIGIAGACGGDITAAHALDADGHSIKLSYVGRAPSLRQQAQPLLFKVEEIHDGLIIGSAVKVYVQQGDAVDGIVLPDDAVVRGPNGLPQVWVKISAERFQPVPVRLHRSTAPTCSCRRGRKGSRVVVEGAELINQVR